MKGHLAAGQFSSDGWRKEGWDKWGTKEGDQDGDQGRPEGGRTYELWVTASSMDGFGLNLGDIKSDQFSSRVRDGGGPEGDSMDGYGLKVGDLKNG